MDIYSILRGRHGYGTGLAQHRGMETSSSGDSPEKPKFEKVDSFTFKKLTAQRPTGRCAPFYGAGFASARQFETFIFLCVMLAIGARRAAAMAAEPVTEQVPENRQIWEDNRQNRQENGDSNATETREAMENRAVADDSEVTSAAMTPIVPRELPNNLRVPDNMRPMLMRMLQNSATFRRQIATLSKKPAVRVSVAYGGVRGDRNYHALSTVRKHQWGAMLVDTTVFVPTDLVEIIAHELEHVCEQMEGVDLRTLAKQKGEGVYDLNGHFETARAIRAGQDATREFHQDGPDSLQQANAAPY